MAFIVFDALFIFFKRSSVDDDLDQGCPPSPDLGLRTWGLGHLKSKVAAALCELYSLFKSEISLWPLPSKDKRTVMVELPRLFEAALKGKWKDAKKIFDQDHEATTAGVMTVDANHLTVLEVAVMAARDQFVENLLEDFLQHLQQGNVLKRALTIAVRRGRIRMVKALVKKVRRPYQNTTKFTDDPVHSALVDAALYAPMHKEVIWYLATCTRSDPDYLTLSLLISAGYLEIALYLARPAPDSLMKEDNTEEDDILKSLGRMKLYFLSGARLNFWETLVYKCIPLYLVDTSIDFFKKGTRKDRALSRLKISLWNLVTIIAPFSKRIGELKWRHKCSREFVNLILDEKKKHNQTTQVLDFLTRGGAPGFASHGIWEIVSLCFEHFPELIWEKNLTKQLTQKAVDRRDVELFRVVNALKKITESRDGYNMDHELMEAFIKRPPGCVSTDVQGATFLMQREIQWYRVLEDMMDPSTRYFKLEENKTYWENFVEKRRDLHKEATKWINETSSSCTLVATLIITVVFAAAFTVPGGNNDNTGIPIFQKRDWFVVFVVTDTLALFSSVTAILMFLAILTSRYDIEDFQYSLPGKMLLGLTFLFLSLAFMLMAFSSTLPMILSGRMKWMFTLLPVIPVGLFVILQLPLYVEMVKSTIWPRLRQPL